MALDNSNSSQPFDYDMTANNSIYDTPQQRNGDSEYYPDGKDDVGQPFDYVTIMSRNATSHDDFRKDSALSTVGDSTYHGQFFPGPALDTSHATYAVTDHRGYMPYDSMPVYQRVPHEWVVSPTESADTKAFEAFPPGKFETSPFPGSLPSDQQAFAPIHEQAYSHTHYASSEMQASTSPAAYADWMDMTGPNKQPNSDVKPIKPRHQAILKRDGVRKKNAKIAIPSEITLENIDDLMGSCTDEEEMKQLKAQKRLLRNREAALASRQRKKKHTESLEQKEKDLEGKLHMLYQQIDTLKMQLDTAENQKRFFAEERAKEHELVQSLHIEKEDLICNHIRETGHLRSQIRFYREQFESHTAPAMSAAPSSTGFTDFNLEMDHLQIEDQSWDRFVNDTSDFLGDTAESFETLQPGKQLNEHAQQQDMKGRSDTADQPVASGILFMLLLCGAFVASRSSAATLASPSIIPNMPEEVRAASTQVLNNLLKDNPQEAQLFLPDLAQQIPHQYSTANNSSWPQDQQSLPVNQMSDLHKHLTAPTRLQEVEAAFAMTPAQYASLTTYPHMDTMTPATSTHGQRPNVAATLQSLREARNGNTSAAEVYTRSLLWDQIHPDVVAAFKKAVADRHVVHDGDDEMNDGNNDIKAL